MAFSSLVSWPDAPDATAPLLTTLSTDNNGGLAPNSRAHVPGVSVRHPHLGAHQLHGLILATMLCQEPLHLGLMMLLLRGGVGGRGEKGKKRTQGLPLGTTVPSATAGCSPSFPVHPWPSAFPSPVLLPGVSSPGHPLTILPDQAHRPPSPGQYPPTLQAPHPQSLILLIRSVAQGSALLQNTPGDPWTVL